MRKKTKLTCQNPDCRDEFESLRENAKFCCAACRTAAYRIRIKPKAKFVSLDIYNSHESCYLRDIRRELLLYLRAVFQLERTGTVSISSVKKLGEKFALILKNWNNLRKKPILISEQIVWIWEKVDSTLIILVRKNEKNSSQFCQLHLECDVRNGIEKLIGD